MKAGVTTSVVLHAALLGFGLVTLSAPRAFEVTDVESLPVDIIPIEAMTQIQQGDKTAPLKEKAAPVPTKKPDIVEKAETVGDNKVDLKAAPTPSERPKDVKAADAPPPSDKPEKKVVEKAESEPVREPEVDKEVVAATEVKPVAEPKKEITPDPVPETKVAEAPKAQPSVLPEMKPKQEAQAKPPQPETAKTPERKNVEKPVKKEASKPKSQEKQFNADEVAALLNKEKASGGGAKRSAQQASLGGEKNGAGEKLSQSEMDALRGQVQRCWNIPAGAADAGNLKVSVKFKLDRAGALEGSPEIIDGGGSQGVERAAAEAARRAVARCAPYTLPAEKYEAWADVIVHFDPSEMF